MNLCMLCSAYLASVRLSPQKCANYVVFSALPWFLIDTTHNWCGQWYMMIDVSVPAWCLPPSFYCDALNTMSDLDCYLHISVVFGGCCKNVWRIFCFCCACVLVRPVMLLLHHLGCQKVYVLQCRSQCQNSCIVYGTLSVHSDRTACP